MITSNGQPYMNWQTRVFYQTWLKAKDQPGSPLAHFTRVLHRTRDDELTLEVPTVRIDPTHPECDDGCDYAVKDRARAIAAWTTTEDARRCSHVLMAEADYLLVRSPPPSVMLARGHAYGFLFGYIIPWHADAAPASRVLHDPDRWGVPMEDVPQSGNAPQVIHVDDLAEVAPTWADLVELGGVVEDGARRVRVGSRHVRVRLRRRARGSSRALPTRAAQQTHGATPRGRYPRRGVSDALHLVAHPVGQDGREAMGIR